METNKDIYPAWITSESCNLPVGMKFSYKYIVVNTITQAVHWESLPKNDNREYIITSSGDFVLNDEQSKNTQIYIEKINNDIDLINLSDSIITPNNEEDNEFEENVREYMNNIQV